MTVLKQKPTITSNILDYLSKSDAFPESLAKS